MAFELEALGGLRLLGADGQVVQAQRRRLALLGLLAAAGERGLTRDQLMGCLWPDATEDNARHALNQLLYGIRRSLSENALRGADPVRLDPGVVDSDVRRFESALSAGAYAEAVAHYRGPFLNGFYLHDAPEFESRVEGQRARLAAAYADALDRLAVAAEHRGDAAGAVAWRRTLAELDRLDARRATALMRALAAAGDSTGAVAHGRMYEALVRGELDAPGDPAVIALAREIRASSARQPMTAAAPALAIPPEAPGGPGAQRRTSGGETSHSVSVQPVVSLESLQTPSGGRTVPLPADPSPAAHIAPTPPAPSLLRRWALRSGVAALLLVIVLFGAIRQGVVTARDTPAGTSEPSIAVLPLANLSSDPDDAPLADRMTEELIATLARGDNVRVIASTSVSAFRGHKMDVRDIADSLGVSNILEGGFGKIGSRLRVDVRLVDRRDGSIRWSETYDREFKDIFSIEDEIARAVAGELGLRFDRQRQLVRHKTQSIAAYELYLRGWDPVLLRNQAGIWKAQGYFQEAVAADSMYAAAHASLALMYVRRARTANDPAMPLPRLLTLAEATARKAISLDDSLAEAHYALAQVLETKLDFPSAEREIRRAIALDPTRSVYRRRLAYLKSWTGRPEEELAEARRALETDPLNPYAITAVAGGLYGLHRYDEALAQLDRLSAIKPPLQGVSFIVAQCYARKQMWAEAIAALRPQAEDGDPAFIALLGYMLARAGQRDEANRILADLLARRERTASGAFEIATVHAGLGDRDQAFAWLDKSIDDYSISSMVMGLAFEELHRDPRFARLRERLGLQQQP